MQNRFTRRRFIGRVPPRCTAARLFAKYLTALKAGAEVARAQFGGAAIPVTVERPVTDQVTRSVRVERFSAMLEIGADGVSTRIVPAEDVAFNLVDVDSEWNSTEPLKSIPVLLNDSGLTEECPFEGPSENGHPIWWKISGIPVEISRHTWRGKSMTAVVMEHLELWSAN